MPSTSGGSLRQNASDRFGAVVAGLAGDKAQLDQLLVAEEREVRDARAELAPVKPRSAARTTRSENPHAARAEIGSRRRPRSASSASSPWIT